MIFLALIVLAGAVGILIWLVKKEPRLPDEVHLAPEAEASPHARIIMTLHDHTFEIGK